MKRFVHAKLKHEEGTRQGVVIEETADTLIILGESGARYECEPDATTIPLKNLFGSTLKFALAQGVEE